MAGDAAKKIGTRSRTGEVASGRGRRQPHRLSRVVVDAIHDDRCENMEASGIRDENALIRPGASAAEVALREPRIAAAGCAYAFGLVKNHRYRDGNKRIGFLAMATFLGVNGYAFSATNTEVGVAKNTGSG